MKRKLTALMLTLILVSVCIPCHAEELALEAPMAEEVMTALDGYMYAWGTSAEDVQKDIEAKGGTLYAYGDQMNSYYLEICGLYLEGSYSFNSEGLRNVSFAYRTADNDILLTMDMYQEIVRYFTDALGYASGRTEDRVMVEADEWNEFTYYYSGAFFYPPENNAWIYVGGSEKENGELIGLVLTAEQWP